MNTCDDQHSSPFIGLFVRFFRFSEGLGVDGMIDNGGVPSDSGEGDFLSNNEVFFFKVGRETLEDGRVGLMKSRR